MTYTVFDIETDGLLDSVTKIHCLSYRTFTNGDEVAKGSIVVYSKIIDFILNQEILVGHNIIRYDIPVLEKILGIKVKARLIDTLALSWYLYPLRIKHGLENWGEELGVKKPVIVDWANLALEDYIHRCESDVKINHLLFNKQMAYLLILYEGNLNAVNSIRNYLGYKLDCAKEQEEVKCKIDKDLVINSLLELNNLRVEKVNALTEAMPINIKFKETKKPSKMYKKDGTETSAALKWFNLLEDNNLEPDYSGTIVSVISEEPGNPTSSAQLKDWLFTLGWVPKTFKHLKNTAGDINTVPQIYVEDAVCDSIKDLYSIEPSLENLDMLSLINHRISILEGYLRAIDTEDYVKAEIAGFTNTLRFKHKKPIVNLPKVFKFYGEQIRGAIIAPDDNYTLCGSDMSSLEDSTKQHYMYFFDPDYVTQMRVPGFDPHLDIGILAKMITPEQAERHKSKQEDFSQVRNLAKVVNFSAVYGAGPPKISLSTGMPLAQAQALHKTYWERNKAVKQIAKSVTTKSVTVDGITQMWLLNPVSGFWYSLRYEKDKFSTLNQGTGVYCFDLWVKEVRSRGIKLMLQYHDEIAFPLLKEQQEHTKIILLESIKAVNDTVKLNVPLSVSVDFGINYAKIH